MKPFNIMHEKITNVVGWVSTGGAFGLNLKAWVMKLDVNQTLTIVISVFSLIFLLMKMYDQYLVTKKRKEGD